MVEQYDVSIVGSFGYLQGKVIRIGYMGKNAKKDKIVYTLLALGFKCKRNMVEVFRFII